MNGYTFVTLCCILLITSCVVPTLDYHVERLDKQANGRLENLQKLGR